jgi:hypothetical protein
MDIISANREAGTYGGAAVVSGTTRKTVMRVIARHEAGGGAPTRGPRPHNYDAVAELVAARGEVQLGADIGEAAAVGRAGGRVREVGAGLPAAGRGVQAGAAG